MFAAFFAYYIIILHLFDSLCPYILACLSKLSSEEIFAKMDCRFYLKAEVCHGVKYRKNHAQ